MCREDYGEQESKRPPVSQNEEEDICIPIIVKNKPHQKKGIQAKYHITPKVLGAGGFGKVFKINSLADPNIVFASKMIYKRDKNVDIEEVKQEIDILKTLDHPNIIKYIDTFEDQKYIYIISELCPGGELFTQISEVMNQKGHYSESEAAGAIKTILKAVNYIHSKKIAHRDIKPENIMIGDDGHLKLIDFGLSEQMNDQKLIGKCGSPYYVAPEVLKGEYGLGWDIWSVGIILFLLLSGYIPFNGETTKKILNKVKTGNIVYDKKKWAKISEDGQDLVKNMLQTDWEKRFTAKQCLEHKWFKTVQKNKDKSEDMMDKSILENIKRYKGGNTMIRHSINVLNTC